MRLTTMEKRPNITTADITRRRRTTLIRRGDTQRTLCIIVRKPPRLTLRNTVRNKRPELARRRYQAPLFCLLWVISGHWPRNYECLLSRVWTAPSWQELFSRLQHWSVRPCVRPLDAVHMTAGRNGIVQ
jgi:hypothetical protein